jgi:hypothetical protein
VKSFSDSKLNSAGQREATKLKLCEKIHWSHQNQHQKSRSIWTQGSILLVLLKLLKL